MAEKLLLQKVVFMFIGCGSPGLLLMDLKNEIRAKMIDNLKAAYAKIK